jgi:uncharacterized protein YbjT (DUF2867 family)
MRILVLGAYGFIGLEASRRLVEAGHEVVALGRSPTYGRRVLPEALWRGADIGKLTDAKDWAPLVEDIDAVVNASGALQDGLRDNLEDVQDRAIRALITASERAGVSRFIQISAPDARTDSETRFYRTKASADAALKQSTLSWTLLRPGLVWGRTASGGTALVRMLSVFPIVQPSVLAGSAVQMIDIDAVCDAIVIAVTSDALQRRDLDLVDQRTFTLSDLTRTVREWHGVAPARLEIPVPRWIGALFARVGDLAGWLGWRSPMRTASLLSLEHGVVGDGSQWAALAESDNSFERALRRRPATRQDRVFARTQLLLPLVVLGLSAFWIASGLVGLAQQEQAVAVLNGSLADPALFVISGAIIDIGLGVALLWRPWARGAAFGMIAVTAIYLVAGTIFTPQLWADPLSPLVKPLPAAILALVCVALLEER